MRTTRVFMVALLVAFGGLAAKASAQTTRTTLDIYIADTEGGKATLFVTPSGQTVLIDTGNPGARDLERIMDVIASAGVTKIDYLISTHYHTDHIGGLEALAKRIPIAHYMDHGASVEAREAVPGFQAAYAELKAKAKHTVLHAGDRIPIKGIDWRIVTSAGKAIATPLPGAGGVNAVECASFQRHADAASPDDNGQSVGSVITFGRFRAIDLGDLLWNNEVDLVCPRNNVGTVDFYLVTHHGLDQSGSPVLVHAIQPRVAIMQNGPRKGGAIATFQTLRGTPGLEDIWTMHWSYAAGMEHNSAGVFIANIDDTATIASVLNDPSSAQGNPAHAPAYSLKISARTDGTFTVTNSRNGFSKTYAAGSRRRGQ
ncbi:hypothetical protein BH11GEM1_BH11GEM1_24950 [soil metagenome]